MINHVVLITYPLNKKKEDKGLSTSCFRSTLKYMIVGDVIQVKLDVGIVYLWDGQKLLRILAGS